ncbi:hypothetical protein BU24DRAFT_460773 [Aaosphaeria arxii CBS 175.79]|uniref:RING-type domain-containing protein n=1 Tax=Aaosphaeria arxii CBS 175.79 TaxID=1450172 RepID=A0A6A5XWQ9_9PLEO|nr:uncharacterized protein BU24DRAFT_460773 [Aaosphaeria arxii CBS 175.79]KAF2017768.1 hypothetical protein BU24DRAFT_460773 [Aaosphaeria arxii CBS 175.79]
MPSHSAQSIEIYTIEFPDPYKISYHNDKFITLPANASFQLPITENIQTLSNKDVQKGSDPYGILYVPDLTSDGCKKEEEQYVANNVTRRANLPEHIEYALVAVAPWYSAECMNEYFEAARDAPVKAFLVYQPGAAAGMPPPVSDSSWLMGDGGTWKAQNTFPTYAIVPPTGALIMKGLSEYSGNITDLPYNETLVDMFADTDYVRLWATIGTESGSQLPSLWVFLVIVLGLLILAIVGTSSFMHLMQRRRRNDLQRRVINGEVDLEALGVKRLTVPQEYLDKLPLYVYTSSMEDPEKALPTEPPQAHSNTPTGRRLSAPDLPQPVSSTALSQPTCAICLDDFVANESRVRELPCRHIFHPDCIDTFLLSNSSLCPMCKTSVLPSGYCPTKITNNMVRRERMITRMNRNAADRAHTAHPAPPQTADSQAPLSPRRTSSGFGSIGSRIGGAFNGSRRVFSAPDRTSNRPSEIEMGSNQPAAALSPVPETTPPNQQTTTTDPTNPTAAHPHRREWARQRALALLGTHHVAPADEEESCEPRWKRGLRKIFPGFR